MTMEGNNAPRTYSSLDDIRAYKAELKEGIRSDEERIGKLWNELFSKKPASEGRSTLSISKVLSVGSSVVDGTILAWKIYRKFKRGTIFPFIGRRRK